jgi:hypothetical protein
MLGTKAYLLTTASGAELILTRHDLEREPEALKELAIGGLNKFVVYEVPLGMIKENYRAHLEHAIKDPKLQDHFIVLDPDGRQVFANICLRDIGNPIVYEEEAEGA